MNDPFFVRNMVYGLEDSLISTSGMVIGMSAAGMPNSTVITAGTILVLVESMSMAFGSFVSEDSFMTHSDIHHTWKDVVKYSVVMLASYMLAGLIPMLPFLLDVQDAWKWSLGGTLVSLFMLMRWYKKKTSDAVLLTTIAAAILAITITMSRRLEQ